MDETSPASLKPDAPDPAVYFSDPETAYETLLRWAQESTEHDGRRDALVRGALRVFPPHGGIALVRRGYPLVDDHRNVEF